MSLSTKLLRWVSGVLAINALCVAAITSWSVTGTSESPVGEPPDVQVPEVNSPDPPSLNVGGLTASAAAETKPEPGSPTAHPPTDPPTDQATVQSTILPTIPHELPTNGSPPGVPPLDVSGAASQFVLDEIRKAIESDESLAVPPLKFPTLAAAPGGAPVSAAVTTARLAVVSKRMAALEQLTAAANELVGEAQLHALLGDARQAELLLSQVQLLRRVTGTLAAEDSQPTSVAPTAEQVP